MSKGFSLRLRRKEKHNRKSWELFFSRTVLYNDIPANQNTQAFCWLRAMLPDTTGPLPWQTVTKDSFLAFLSYFFHDSPNWILALPCICHVSFLDSTCYILYSSGLLSFGKSLQGLSSASNGGGLRENSIKFAFYISSPL